jgi:mannose-6-phosphate isomerase-like protein (cupin superfamily)
MVNAGFRVTRIDDLSTVEGHDLNLDADWKPVRHQLGIDVFGINAYVAAEAGQIVIEKHRELDDDSGAAGHHELYFVHTGAAEFTVGGESFEAPAGTLVYLDDPALVRQAVATTAGTTILAIGGQPGMAFEPSEWEVRRTADIPRIAS